jgi:hypothetical protein
MTYWDEKEYWGDASTRNCVWLFETKRIIYPKEGCVCGAEHDDEGNLKPDSKKCECANETWDTEYVFLTKKEAREWGESRPYEWGKEGQGWRAYGVPCCGIMAELLGKHATEFEKEVEHITKPVGKDELPHSNKLLCINPTNFMTS